MLESPAMIGYVVRSMARITLYKLSPSDCERLMKASDRLAVVADTLRAARYANGPALIQLLIEANDDIMAVGAKGAAVIARALERKGVKIPTGESEEGAAGELAQEERGSEERSNVEVG